MRRLPLLCAFVVAFGCGKNTDDLVSVGMASPKLADGWYAIRDEPAGFSFQAPDGWYVNPSLMDSSQHADDSPRVIFVYGPPDSSGLTRPIFGLSLLTQSQDSGNWFPINNLKELSDKALKKVRKELENTEGKQISLPIGPAYDLKGTERSMKGRHTMHAVVFATALRAYMVVYGCATDDFAKNQATFEAMLKSIRILVRHEYGGIVIPQAAIREPNASGPGVTQIFGGEFQQPPVVNRRGGGTMFNGRNGNQPPNIPNYPPAGTQNTPPPGAPSNGDQPTVLGADPGSTANGGNGDQSPPADTPNPQGGGNTGQGDGQGTPPGN